MRVGGAAFGVGHAALASIARASAWLVSPKADALAFEGACTLPTTWTTVHAAFGLSKACAGSAFLLHAGAGGVGLVAVEYAQWARLPPLATAGRPRKHRVLRCVGVARAMSSRDGGGFAVGAAVALSGSRLRGVLNSLSADFVCVSLALLVARRGCFEEIGKRSVWSAACRQARL